MILCSVLVDKIATTNSVSACPCLICIFINLYIQQIFEDMVVVKDTNAIIPTHILLYT